MDNELRDQLISAALDGERVDVEALRGALDTAEGRASLAAFVLLRAATADEDIAPARRFEDFAAAARRPRPAWLRAGPRVPAAWAASIAAIAIAASFWFGTTLRAPNTTLTLAAPPAAPATALAPVIVSLPPAADTAHRESDDAFRPAGSPSLRRVADQPPKPTRMLRFVPGVDWISTTQ